LRHRHIVTIFDVDVHEECPFIAMEFIDGDSLESIIRHNRRPPLHRQIDWLIQLCDGLGYAHRAQIVHRDVKPANVMIDGDGDVKILDFGIARAAADGRYTRTGALIGSIHYMSPEAVAGEGVDARSDMFAVGLVMYELLTGRRAFDGSSDAAVLNLITSAAPEPIDRYVDVPPRVAAIVDRALQKMPSGRFADMEEMARALASARTELDPGTTDETVLRPIERLAGPAVWKSEEPVSPPDARGIRTRDGARRWQRSAVAALSQLVVVAVAGFTWWAVMLPLHRPSLPVRPAVRLAPIIVPGVPEGRLVTNVAPPVEPASSAANVNRPAGPLPAEPPNVFLPEEQAASPSAVNTALPPLPEPTDVPGPRAGIERETDASPPAGVATTTQTVEPTAVGADPGDEPDRGGGPPNPPVRADPEADVRLAIARYEDAYRQRDLAALARVFPSGATPRLRDAFANAASYRMTVSDAVVRVTGDTAVVTGVASERFVPQSGVPLTGNLRVTFHLRKTADGWIIVERK
jgi:serine/threonine-protein kinase